MKVYLVTYQAPYSLEILENMEVFATQDLAEQYIQRFITDPYTFYCYNRNKMYYGIQEFNLIEK